MRILHLLDHALPYPGQYSHRLAALLRAQQAMGWQTCQLTGPHHAALTRGVDHGADGAACSSLHFYRTAAPAGDLAGISLLGTLDLLTRRLDQVVRLTRPTLLHAHSPTVNALAALRVGRRHRLPVVFEAHAPAPGSAPGTVWTAPGQRKPGGSDSGRLIRYAGQALECWAARHAGAVITNSDGMCQRLRKGGVAAARITVVPDGLDMRSYSGGRSARHAGDGNAFGSLGRPGQRHGEGQGHSPGSAAEADGRADLFDSACRSAYARDGHHRAGAAGNGWPGRHGAEDGKGSSRRVPAGTDGSGRRGGGGPVGAAMPAASLPGGPLRLPVDARAAPAADARYARYARYARREPGEDGAADAGAARILIQATRAGDHRAAAVDVGAAVGVDVAVAADVGADAHHARVTATRRHRTAADARLIVAYSADGAAAHDGWPLLLAAVALLRHRHPDLALCVACDSARAAGLRAAATQRALDEHLFLLVRAESGSDARDASAADSRGECCDHRSSASGSGSGSGERSLINDDGGRNGRQRRTGTGDCAIGASRYCVKERATIHADPHGALHAMADLVVFPHVARNPAAAPPRRLLQAMARGCVIAAADTAVHRNLVAHGRNGMLFAPGDAAAMADVLGVLIANRGAWPAMRDSARWFIEYQRSWEACVAHYQPVYDALAGSGRR